MIFGLLLATGVALLAYGFYKLSTNGSRYFEERNLKYIGILSGLQDMIGMLSGRKNFLELVQKVYYTFPDES